MNDEAQPNIWLPEDKLPGFRGFMEQFFNVSNADFNCIGSINTLARNSHHFFPFPGMRKSSPQGP